MITVALPFPPGVNNLYANAGRRRVISRPYEVWRRAAGFELIAQRPDKLTGPFCVTLRFDRPDKRRRDLDGLAKAVLDLLVTHQIVGDDSQAESLCMLWSEVPPAKPGRCYVYVSEAA